MLPHKELFFLFTVFVNYPYSFIEYTLAHNLPDHATFQHHSFTPAPKSINTRLSMCQEAGAICVLPIQCPAHLYFPPKNKCNVAGGRQGICCKTGQNHTDIQQIKKQRDHIFIEIDEDSLNDISQRGYQEVSNFKTREAELLALEKPPIVPFGAASYGHFRNRRIYDILELSDVVNLANKALEIAFATRAFKERRGITIQQLEWNMMSLNLKDSPLHFACPVPLPCPSRFELHRRIDGSCNNLAYPRWGMQFSPYSRLLPPSYEDGVWWPRLSIKREEDLPSPRLISTTLFPDIDSPNYEYTLMLSQFGQFVSHDITFSIDTSFPNGSAISCCTEDGSETLPPHYQHYACMPIEVPEDDPFYSGYGVRCMNFVRSLLAPRQDCTLGYAQQMNKITHFIDASSIYGSTLKEMRSLRSFEGGKLRVFEDYGRQLLPLTKDPSSCLTMERGSACFDSGDSRTNQIITLVAMHTLFLREHNRIAQKLEELNSHWPDEKIFWEARKILIAEIQVIIYKEFLPCLLGETTMEEFDLNLSPDFTYSFSYDPNIEPSVTNEFATAAYRFGHSMVNGLLKVYGKNKMEEMISIPEVMFLPARMRKREYFDEILSTLTTEPVQQVDNSISEGLTKYLFKAGNPFGIDLAAVNIQRGRDHGLRPYNDYRELVGLPRMNDFYEFGNKIGDKLSQTYASVDDIDLWVGGLLEPKEFGSVLGPTFRDIVADQFARLKNGDRYFFENDPSVNPGYFTLEQLNEVKHITMARIICDNSDGILLIKQAPNAFKKPGVYGNEFVECQSPRIPVVDLTYWEE